MLTGGISLASEVLLLSRQILSIWGLYVYDKTLFDTLKLPESVDKATLVNNLLIELGDLETVYPNIEFMKVAIEAWSNKEFPVWDELCKTLYYEYDPICNYDRTEEFTFTRSGNSRGSGSGESSNSGSVNGNGNIVSKIRAFNSPDLENKESADSEETRSIEGDESSSFENNREYSETNTHKANTKGNIGVTTTQQMIEEQRKVVRFNIYDHIIDSFKSRFCVLVW